jgi:hypothetical protein
MIERERGKRRKKKESSIAKRTTPAPQGPRERDVPIFNQGHQDETFLQLEQIL